MPHLTFQDVLLAKMLAESQVVDVEALKKLLRQIDANGGDLRAAIGATGMANPQSPAMLEVDQKVNKYVFMMYEAIFAEGVKKSGAVPADTLKRMQRFQRKEDFARPLSEILIQAGYLKRKAVQKLQEKIEKRLRKHELGIVKQYRDTDFSGLNRSLTKGEATNKSPNTFKTGTTKRLKRNPIPGGKLGKPANPYVGRVLDARFKLEKFLGQGGMGMVYLASDQQDNNKQVAIKLILDAQKNPEVIKRFKREILVTGHVKHENIVDIYGHGEMADGTFYMAMEFIDGDELQSVIKEKGRLPLKRTIDIVEQVLEGLAVVHNKRIAHRDMKPENLMITQDEEGRDLVKIMDFGLARFLDKEEIEEELEEKIFQTMAGNVTGSPGYLAPETINADYIDGRTDLYAMGIIIVQLLTGALPFEAKTAASYIGCHLYKKPKKLTQILPDMEFPTGLQEIIDKLLEKQIKDRPANCEEVLQVLREQVRPQLT